MQQLQDKIWIKLEVERNTGRDLDRAEKQCKKNQDVRRRCIEEAKK